MLPRTNVLDDEKVLNSAMEENYGTTLENFLYYTTGDTPWARARGLKSLNRGDGHKETSELLNAYLAI